MLLFILKISKFLRLLNYSGISLNLLVARLKYFSPKKHISLGIRLIQLLMANKVFNFLKLDKCFSSLIEFKFTFKNSKFLN